MFFAWAGLDCDPFTSTSYVTGMTGVHQHSQFVCRDEGLDNFCLGWT
jgi:hypothetical protein